MFRRHGNIYCGHSRQAAERHAGRWAVDASGLLVALDGSGWWLWVALPGSAGVSVAQHALVPTAS